MLPNIIVLKNFAKVTEKDFHKKEEVWTVWRFKGGLVRRMGGGVFLMGVDILMHTMYSKEKETFTQICNQQYAKWSTQKIYLCLNLQIKKCRVPAMLINIPVVNMWSPMIQKVRINQYHFLKRLLMTCAWISI